MIVVDISCMYVYIYIYIYIISTRRTPSTLPKSMLDCRALPSVGFRISIGFCDMDLHCDVFMDRYAASRRSVTSKFGVPWWYLIYIYIYI